MCNKDVDVGDEKTNNTNKKRYVVPVDKNVNNRNLVP